MQVSLFRAFKSINIENEIAERAVKVIEEHIAMSVAQALKPLEDKIDTLSAKIDLLGTKIEVVGITNQKAIASLSAEMKSVKWVSATGLLAVAGVAAGIAAKLIL